MSQKTPDTDFKVVFGMIAALVIPAVITLLTIRQSPQPIFGPETPNPSPLGYTWSLTLFIIPALALKGWFLRHPQFRVEKKSYWLTIFILTPMGFCLDLFFGNSFFTFENRPATLGVRLPGYTFGQGWAGGSIPLEEFLFYFTGFIMILVVYVWGDMYWFGAYNIDDYRVEVRKIGRIISFHWWLAAAAAALIVAAIFFKRFAAPSAYRDGFPGYFTFMVLAGIVPTTLLFKTAKPFINWRAFSFSLLLVLFLSLLWEGTLGVPYAWWGYQSKQMMGIVAGPWANLPLEAVTLWFIASWITVNVYEVLKIYLYMGRPTLEAFIGVQGSSIEPKQEGGGP